MNKLLNVVVFVDFCMNQSNKAFYKLHKIRINKINKKTKEDDMMGIECGRKKYILQRSKQQTTKKEINEKHKKLVKKHKTNTQIIF